MHIHQIVIGLDLSSSDVCLNTQLAVNVSEHVKLGSVKVYCVVKGGS